MLDYQPPVAAQWWTQADLDGADFQHYQNGIRIRHLFRKGPWHAWYVRVDMPEENGQHLMILHDPQKWKADGNAVARAWDYYRWWLWHRQGEPMPERP